VLAAGVSCVKPSYLVTWVTEPWLTPIPAEHYHCFEGAGAAATGAAASGVKVSRKKKGNSSACSAGAGQQRVGADGASGNGCGLALCQGASREMATLERARGRRADLQEQWGASGAGRGHGLRALAATVYGGDCGSDIEL
jgi:hypothetical protein